MCAIAPTEQTRRIVHLDVIRGFALGGILLVNFEWFSRSVLGMWMPPEGDSHGLDRGVDLLIAWLATDKFYPLFAMLFGAGFALMAHRARLAERSFFNVFFRRTLVLALFGILHIALVWSGDILLMYAVAALLMMLLFGRTPVPRLWKWGLALISIPVVLIWMFAGLYALASLDPQAYQEMREGIERERIVLEASIERGEAIHAEGSFLQNVEQRLRDTWSIGVFGLFMWLSMVLGFFMIGRWLILSGVLSEIHDHVGWLRRWRLIGLGLGLPIAAVATLMMFATDWMTPSPRLAAGLTLLTAASVVLPLGYLATVALAHQRLRFLAPAGRMALTHYLLQSIIWTFVFYGYGLGMWQQVPRVWHPVLAMAFFALQVAASHWWLKRFRFGPAEWLWRCLTYWQWQPFRRSPA